MNRSKFRMLAAAAAATGILGFSGMAIAQPGPGPHRGGPALTPEQQEIVKKYRTEHLTSTESVRKALIIKRAELKAAMIGQTPDTQRIEQLSKELGELKGKMLAARATLKAQLNKEGIPAHDPHGMGPKGNKKGHHDRGDGHRGGWNGGHRG